MRIIGLIVGAAVAVGAACKSTPSGNGNGCASTGANVTIEARDNQTYSIPSATISPGQKVCWENFGSVVHTVTSDPTALDTTWQLNEQLNPGFAVLYTSFNKTGVDYHYHCAIHAAMTGVIQVR